MTRDGARCLEVPGTHAQLWLDIVDAEKMGAWLTFSRLLQYRWCGTTAQMSTLRRQND